MPRQDEFVQVRTGKEIAGFQHGDRSREELLKESPELADQAVMDITPTPMAGPSEKTPITSGMMMKGAAPVFTATGRFVGVLIGGVLLNRNYDLVDKIRTTVFKEESYKGQPVGTATIFQDDVRISTNVRNADGSRAITTSVSDEVADAVLKRGDTCRGRAFVVNDWYISAYAPIPPFGQSTIGMLYVGTLERPYQDILWRNLYVFLGITLLAMALVSIVAMSIADYISEPIHAMAMPRKKLPKAIIRKKSEIPRMTRSVSWRATSIRWYRNLCAPTRNCGNGQKRWNVKWSRGQPNSKRCMRTSSRPRNWRGWETGGRRRP